MPSILFFVSWLQRPPPRLGNGRRSEAGPRRCVPPVCCSSWGFTLAHRVPSTPQTSVCLSAAYPSSCVRSWPPDLLDRDNRWAKGLSPCGATLTRGSNSVVRQACAQSGLPACPAALLYSAGDLTANCRSSGNNMHGMRRIRCSCCPCASKQASPARPPSYFWPPMQAGLTVDKDCCLHFYSAQAPPTAPSPLGAYQTSLQYPLLTAPHPPAAMPT